jgi:hypothetical protein
VEVNASIDSNGEGHETRKTASTLHSPVRARTPTQADTKRGQPKARETFRKETETGLAPQPRPCCGQTTTKKKLRRHARSLKDLKEPLLEHSSPAKPRYPFSAGSTVFVCSFGSCPSHFIRRPTFQDDDVVTSIGRREKQKKKSKRKRRRWARERKRSCSALRHYSCSTTHCFFFYIFRQEKHTSFFTAFPSCARRHLHGVLIQLLLVVEAGGRAITGRNSCSLAASLTERTKP